MTEEINPRKRIKLDVESKTNSTENNDLHGKSCTIAAILSDHFTEPIKKCFVFVAIIRNNKLISEIMSELCRLMPLNELNHLKRVNKSELILCSAQDLVECLRDEKNKALDPELMSQLNEEIKGAELNAEVLLKISQRLTTSLLQFYMGILGISQKIISLLTDNYKIDPVIANPPILNWQHKEAMRLWPCKFHPNKDLEKLYTGTWFTDEQTTFHARIMEICTFLRKKLDKLSCGVAVDPRTKSIVAIGFDEIDRHPLMHCTMVLIDSVARSQNGGAWNNVLIESNENTDAIYTKSTEYTESGVSPFVRKLISSKFPSITFDTERVKAVTDNGQDDIESSSLNGDNLAKYGPYLCTGYDVYLWQEPCVMCSMALTHSRIRTIFFHKKQTHGAIHSLTKLQSVKALNHHFQVFHIDGDI